MPRITLLEIILIGFALIIILVASPWAFGPKTCTPEPRHNTSTLNTTEIVDV